jgi:hypothetical protein
MKTINSNLLVGGPCDRQHRAFPELQTRVVFNVAPAALGVPADTVAYQEVAYCLQAVPVNDETQITCWLLEGQPIELAYQRIIESLLKAQKKDTSLGSASREGPTLQDGSTPLAMTTEFRINGRIAQIYRHIAGRYYFVADPNGTSFLLKNGEWSDAQGERMIPVGDFACHSPQEAKDVITEAMNRRYAPTLD